jgi:predicted dehydrogenase
MDLAQFVVAQPIQVVLADLATVHSQRRRPVGPSETFSRGKPRRTTEMVPVITDDFAAVLLGFEQEISGAFHVSQVMAGRKNRIVLEVAGSEGSMAWESDSPDRLWIGRRNEPNQVLERDPALLSPAARMVSDYPGGHVEGFPDTFKQLFRAVYDHLGREIVGTSPYPTFEDGDHEIRLCEAIARSAVKGAWVEVSPRGS